MPIDDLLALMRRLRDAEQGCPWDREQTLKTLVKHTLEEAYEVADAIERDALDELPSELGDLLFQIVFYARLGEESGEFDFEDVVRCIHSKLVRRHPHLFEQSGRGDSSQLWEALKARERALRSPSNASELDHVPLALPALTRARKLQERAARVGFDWTEVSPVFAKFEEELAELKAAVASGDRAASRGRSRGCRASGQREIRAKISCDRGGARGTGSRRARGEPRRARIDVGRS